MAKTVTVGTGIPGGLSRRADSFEVGQRVQLSGYADEAGLRLQKRGGSSGRTGRVVKVEPPFHLHVLPDGYSRSHRYAPGFWTEVEGKGKRGK
jgi:hypothetical protein